MTEQATSPSARHTELLEAAYHYALEHGIADISLRPLAAAIGSSPRVLIYLFGNKDGLVRALLTRARTDELAFLDRLGQNGGHARIGLSAAMEQVWEWLADETHRPLLRLWTEAYARSLVEPGGVWTGFAESTVNDWLAVLAEYQSPTERRSKAGIARRTLALAVLRGALLDLLATDDDHRTGAAIKQHVVLLDH